MTGDYKRALLKEKLFPFHAVSNGSTWKRSVIKSEKRSNFVVQKGEVYKISKALHISHNTVTKVIQKFLKDKSATILQKRPSRPRKLTSTGASYDKKG
uniref:Uncharacterized protein n=1 Tax=Nothobranchius pienaari TaxID=704102 RepID=A0A1A8M8D9_9TELE